MKTTGTPAVEWPPGGASSTTSTASPRRAPTDFGALLDQHQARTAVAEGPKKKEAHLDKKVEKDTVSAHAPQPAEPKAPEAKPEATAPATEQQQPQSQPEGDQGDQPKVETPVVAVDPLTELTQPVLAEPQPQQPTPPAAQQPAAEVPAQQQGVATEQTPVAVQAPVTAPAAPAEAAAPAVEQSTQPQQQQQVEQPAAPAAAEQAPAEAPATDDAAQVPVARADKPAQPQPQAQAQAQQAPQAQQQQTGQQPQGQGADQRPADQPRAQAQAPVQPQQAAAAPKPEHAAAPAPVAAPGSAAPVAAPAATATQQQQPVAQTRSVPLSRAAEAVENVIRLGSARGVTHARMSLRPAELGGVEIHLQQTGKGLIASVVADGVQAAQALQQAGHDLRRQLEAHGIELQRLDISYSGDERSGARSAQAETSGERRSPGGSNDSLATDGGDLTPTDEATAIATLELPDGVLVDVLA